MDGDDRTRRSDYKYVPIRRLALYIEESLYRGAEVGGLRAERRAAVGADPAQRRRVHARPVHARARSRARSRSDAYFVRCDARDDHAGRSQQGHRQHLGRVRAAQARRVRRALPAADGRPDVRGLKEEGSVAQFTVNTHRFDPYKNFKFRVKWDGEYVAGISQGRARSSARPKPVTHREGGDVSTPASRRARGSSTRSRSSAASRTIPTSRRGRTWSTTPTGDAAMSLKNFPQGHHDRAAQRAGRGRQGATTSIAAGCRSTRRCPSSTPTPTRSRSRTCPAERRLGARRRRRRTDRDMRASASGAT